MAYMIQKTRQPRIRLPTGKTGGGITAVGPKRPTAYTPFAGTPTSPPPNSYDPALDAQAGQSQRGLADLMAQDVTTHGRRLDDYTLQQQNLQRGHDERITDLSTALARGGEDYQHNLGTLNQRFSDQAVAQTNAQRQAGLDLGGAGAEQQQARTFRLGLAKQPLDTNFQRLQQNNQLQVGRTNDALARGLGAAALQYQRGEQDQAFNEAKAGRENTFFQADIGKSKWAQAAQAGYVAPTRPSNEHRGVGGQVFRTAKYGSRTVYVSPDGRVRSGPPGTAGWGVEINLRTGQPIGRRRGGITGAREGIVPGRGPALGAAY